MTTTTTAPLFAVTLALADDAPVGRDFRDYAALDDRVITIKLTPNRADCLSVLGVAREVAALTGAKLAAPTFAPVLARRNSTSSLCRAVTWLAPTNWRRRQT